MRLVGERVPRLEDRRLVRGAGAYLDDIEPRGCLHAAFLRSEHAHARIASLDVGEARAAPGVAAVFTHADLGHLDRPLPLGIPNPGLHHPRTQLPLVRNTVRLVGEPIAMVVATDRAAAEDALDRLAIHYDLLPAVASIEDALAEKALVHEDVPANVAADMAHEVGDTDAGFAAAAHVVERRLWVERAAAMPIETRGVLAEHDRGSGRLSVYDTTQSPSTVRAGLAGFLRIPEHLVDVVAPDIGGGFGVKLAYWYPEELLVPFAAIRIGCPVKWVEDHREHFFASNHERGQFHEVRLALDAEGRIVALEDTWVIDTGAYVPYGVIVPLVTSNFMPGPYRVPGYRSVGRVVYTNTVPCTPYRGAGQPEACFVMERMLDAAAEKLGISRVEVRRRNLIGPDDFPYRTGTIDEDGSPMEYDSGNPPGLLGEVLRLLDADGIEVVRLDAERRGRRLGFGIGLYMEITGGELYEGARVHVEPSGRVLVATGVGSQGQGHETVLAQIAADTLGVPISDVTVVTGDTRQFKWGVGTFASRVAVIAGNAVAGAAAKVRGKVLALAAETLEAAAEDLAIEEGRVFVKGSPERSVTLHEMAHLANPVRVAYDEAALAASQFAARRIPTLEILEEPGLEATHYFVPSHPTWASGCHAAIVEVDMETLDPSIVRYVAVHDCGGVLNPMLVEGQVCGGVAQGIGGTLYERMHYDADGQLVNASLADLLIPAATEIPNVAYGHLETISSTNPLGAKGCGEAGVIPVAAVLVGAIEEALRVPIDESPIDPSRLFELTRAAALA